MIIYKELVKSASKRSLAFTKDHCNQSHLYAARLFMDNFNWPKFPRSFHVCLTNCLWEVETVPGRAKKILLNIFDLLENLAISSIFGK